jgi:hypothetical protein
VVVVYAEILLDGSDEVVDAVEQVAADCLVGDLGEAAVVPLRLGAARGSPAAPRQLIGPCVRLIAP